MIVFINDEKKELTTGISIAGMFKELGIADTKGLAVAIDSKVVLRQNWETTGLSEECKVLLIRATKGG